ncbi:hypothetical protein POM88_036526 [Heracleum sosnowskyi]|uniref:Uncharacterized protein n=1 Tax=Heracleum sosnowskyi TaxID=360622 RepID=A0AAD8HNH5_9APIA|nr:hypothetical protein POM88_036526 [Heracleum sosnowskyi]
MGLRNGKKLIGRRRRMGRGELENERAPCHFLGVTVPFALLFLHIYKIRQLKGEERFKFSSEGVPLSKIEGEDLDLPLFDLIKVSKATNNFSNDNKLGGRLWTCLQDLGLARSLSGSQTEESRKRVVGTYGYMSPKYTIDRYVWMSYKEDNLLGLVDAVILESSNKIQVFGVIEIGLLCVQECPVKGPSMSRVVLMLSRKIHLPDENGG